MDVTERLAVAWRTTGRWGLHEAALVIAAFLVYFATRAAVVSRSNEALHNAHEIIELERTLGIYWELEMQSWILDSYELIRLANWVYFWGHMPLVIVFAVWLYFRHRHAYSLVRNAFLASGAIAIVMYATYPLAPPRLVPFEGFVDTMALFDRVSYQAQETKAFVNPYAAMPSLHFGWSLLLGIVVARSGKNMFWSLLGYSWPVAMFLSIVITGNHFILDAVAGAAVSFAGYAVALAIEQARPVAWSWARERFPQLEPAQARSGERDP